MGREPQSSGTIPFAAAQFPAQTEGASPNPPTSFSLLPDGSQGILPAVKSVQLLEIAAFSELISRSSGDKKASMFKSVVVSLKSVG